MKKLMTVLVAAAALSTVHAGSCEPNPPKLSAISAVNAYLDGEIESPTFNKDGQITKGKVYNGSAISAYSDESKGLFQSWTVKPASLVEQIGEENLIYDGIEFEMPAEAVTVTANTVAKSKCGACVYFMFSGTDEVAWSNVVGTAWSPDKGKTWIPDGCSYPLATGTYTVKFRAPEGWVAPEDLTLVVGKPQTYTDEWEDDSGKKVRETYYEPDWIERNVLFYPTNETMLTTVKFDGNGGKPEVAKVVLPTAFVAEKGLMALPKAQPRSGYVFDGWWTAKEGGEKIVEGVPFDPMSLDPASNSLYAHWQKTYTVTFGGSGMYAYAWDEEERFPAVCAEGDKGTKLAAVGNGQLVEVSAQDSITDKNGKELVFQKWLVTPSTTVLPGESYDVRNAWVEFLMPEVNITLTPVYVEEEKCGRLSAYAWSEEVYLGWNEETGDQYLAADDQTMQWSPDGGKTWYYSGADAMLAAGKYTVQWRSTSPMWQAPTDKTTVQVKAGDDLGLDAVKFTFVPVVVVDCVTADGGEPTGCSATVNPKDGRLPAGKTATLTAKPSKDYAFQGWFLERSITGELLWPNETEKTYKLVNKAEVSPCGEMQASYLQQYVNPDDYKVHVVALFKALSDYTQEDLASGFFGISGNCHCVPEPESLTPEKAKVTLQGVIGCDFDYWFDFANSVGPLVYKKLSGQLPKGVKFDAKVGEFTGVPTAAGKTECVISVMDPAKHVFNVTVCFDIQPLKDGFAGEYRAFLYDGGGYSCYYDENGELICDEIGRTPAGLLEMSIAADGKVTAKIIHPGGTTSLKGTLYWSVWDDEEEFGIDLYDKNYDNAIWAWFNEDGGLIGGWSVTYKNGSEEVYLSGDDIRFIRQKKDLLALSSFNDKYFTLAFETDGADESRDTYGYLTIKTDKKGVAKVAGKLPDGTAISASTMILPECFGGEPAASNIWARIFVFNAPSAYKKNGWLALPLELIPYEDGGLLAFSSDGSLSISGEAEMAVVVEPPAYTLPAAACEEWEPSSRIEHTILTAIGAEYSAAQTLEGYYWQIFCASSSSSPVNLLVQRKEEGETWYDYVYAWDFDGAFFDVLLAGDKKGSIGLKGKSPAPWKDGSEWNYWEDKKGIEITDPSQLSFSFTKATGIFSGKANVYFDYHDDKEKPQHKAVSVPYAGVMVIPPVESGIGMLGSGSAVYSAPRVRWYYDCKADKDKPFTYTKKVCLPVQLMPVGMDVED